MWLDVRFYEWNSDRGSNQNVQKPIWHRISHISVILIYFGRRILPVLCFHCTPTVVRLHTRKLLEIFVELLSWFFLEKGLIFPHKFRYRYLFLSRLASLPSLPISWSPSALFVSTRSPIPLTFHRTRDMCLIPVSGHPYLTLLSDASIWLWIVLCSWSHEHNKLFPPSHQANAFTRDGRRMDNGKR